VIVLDTDHLSVAVDERDRRYPSLRAKMLAEDNAIGTTIVSVEELLRGWLVHIHGQHAAHRQISAYERLADLFDVLSSVEILRFDNRAADEFVQQRRQGLRVGTMDLKIASIALVNNALLLTANTRDFSQVPGLRFENWLE